MLKKSSNFQIIHYKHFIYKYYLSIRIYVYVGHLKTPQLFSDIKTSKKVTLQLNMTHIKE